MFIRIAFATLLSSSLVFAQAIPDRPEKLSFKPITFQPPKAKDLKVKLKNGVTAILVPDPTGQPLITFKAILKGGTQLDEAGKEGAMHLLGELLDSSGTERLDADKLSEEVETYAARVSSTSDDVETWLRLNLMEKDTEKGLALFMEMLTQPRFQQDRIDLAKKQTRQAMERRNDDTTGIEHYLTGYLVRGENYYTNRHTIAASLDAITRDDLKALHAKLLHPHNLIVTVSGHFDRKAMLKRLGETIGTLKAGPKAQISPKIPAPDHKIQPGIYITEKDVNQGRVSLHLSGLRQQDPDWPAVQVMNRILGDGGFTARLVKKIRSDEGLSYQVRSRFTSGEFYTGSFSVIFQTKVRTVAYGIRLALAELDRIKKDLVSEEELQVAKGAIIDGFPDRFSSSAEVASLFARMEYSGLPETYYDTYRNRVSAVTREDVQRVAQKYLHTDTIAIQIVGGKAAELEEGDVKDHPGKLSEVAKLPTVMVPLRDPLTMKPMK